jgi:hypothetical protein
MTPEALAILTAAGYFAEDGTAADGMVLPESARQSVGDAARLGPLMSEGRGGLAADAVFRVGTSPVVVFKSASQTSDDVAAEWHRLAWNFGAAPMLWVTTPQYVRLYNAYQPPKGYAGRSPLLKEFPLTIGALDHVLAEVGTTCSRRHIAMGSFWDSDLARPINRRSRIDNVLLRELSALLRELVSSGVRAPLAQKLVGRCIFFQYLVHRGYVGDAELEARFGARGLHQVLTDLDGTYALFRWIRTTFNGDLFPIEDEAAERDHLGQSADKLTPLADFFGHFNPSDKQGRLFPFRFDAIPVELISSIYEKFVHMSETDGAPRRGVHYTPINLVDLVLDPVFEGLTPDARILDPACGSGVFLVESLRRLVWLRSGGAPPTRDLIRSTLLNQVRGVDISPAALSVAAFSLYLALLELDPSPPRGMEALDCLRFDPLQDRVLFATSSFNPALVERLSVGDPAGPHRFDAIVGNPPWTYSAQEKESDRELVRQARRALSNTAEEEDDDEASDDETIEAAETQADAVLEKPELRSGTTYARLSGVPIPPRSTDWAFLWRCRDLQHERTRIALVMKATPFFSLEPKTSASRDAILRSFPNVALVNLSQLRTSRLFQEYEGGEGEERQKKKAAGPALVFSSNCLPTQAGAVTAINIPWTADFQRTGVFELPAEPPKVVSLDALLAEPSLLKAAFFGTERDVWFLDRLSRSRHVVRLGDWWRMRRLAVGQGYQSGDTMPSAHLLGLPRVVAKDLRRGRLPQNLPNFEDPLVHRAREEAIYRGPLVLLPEGRLTAAPASGRYTASFDARDLAFNESFVGVSFRDQPLALARAFAALMHSALVAYQVALLGGTVGIKQTKVEGIDLEAVRVPPLDCLGTNDMAALAAASDAIASNDQRIIASALETIDEIVARAASLTDADRALLADVDRRAKAVLFETVSARRPMEFPPTGEEVETYARNLCSAFNAFASDAEDLVLVPDRYAAIESDLLVLKFTLGEHVKAEVKAIRRTTLDEIGSSALAPLGGQDLPYLKPAKSLRLYVDRSVYLLKPARYRLFSPAAGQSDGDRIIAELMSSEPPVVGGGSMEAQ